MASAAQKELANRFKSSPNAIWRIAANPCSVPFWIFAESLLPSLLFLASRVLLPDFEDLATDTSRRVFQEAVGDPPGRKHRRRSRPRTRPPKPGTAIADGRLRAPDLRSGLKRYLWFPISAVEVAGYTYLLANLMNDAAFAWTSLQRFCPECSGEQTPIEFGPLFREEDFYGINLTESWQPVRAVDVIQNRASWVTTSASCTVPGGSYWASFSAKYDLALTGPLKMAMRTRVRYHIPFTPFTVVRDYVEADLNKDRPEGVMSYAYFEVPIGLTATVDFQVRSFNASIPLVAVRDARLICSGRSVCSS